MYHSINFEIDGKTYNTWDSWRLIPYPRPSVAMPKVRTKYIVIPGRNGQLDISDIMTGRPAYENRTGSWEFYVSRRPFESKESDNWLAPYQKGDHWTTTLHRIGEALHGKRGKVWLEDDWVYAYEGRFALAEKFDVQKDYSKVTIEYNLSPRPVERVTRNDATEGWLWDPFNFELDYINRSVTPEVLTRKEFM